MPVSIGHVLRGIIRGSAGLLSVPLSSISPAGPLLVFGAFLHPFRLLSAIGVSPKMTEDAMIGDGLKPNIVFVLGAPGSGKGTQCSLIVRDLDYVHLSAGDLLRIERDSGSADGEMILAHMKNGTIVPVEVTCALLETAMKNSGKSHFLVDGFPRNKDNLDGWIKRMDQKTNLLCVLFLEAPMDLCVQRILARAASSGRPDDNIESLKKRFETYENDTKPIIAYYDLKGLVRKLDSTETPEQVHQKIVSFLKSTGDHLDVAALD